MRNFIAGLAGLIILLVLVWLGGWFYAEMHLKQTLEARIDQINASGKQQLLYRQMVTSASPFVASVALVDPQLKVMPTADTPLTTVSAARIGAHIDLLHPLTMHMDLPLRLDISSSGNTGVLSFASASSTETLKPSVWLGDFSNPVAAADAKFTGINLLASGGSLQVFWIGSLTLHDNLNAEATTSQTALYVQSDIQDFRISPLFTKLLNLPFNGQIARFSASLTLSGPLNWQQVVEKQASMTNLDEKEHFLLQTAHDWAKAGGHGQGSESLDIGPSFMQANYNIAFDQQVQPKGMIEVTASHLDAFAKAVANSYPQFQDEISQINDALSPYLSNTAQDGVALKINAAYGQNGVFINGRRMEDMPSVDWNDLLSPSSAPAFAPGDGSGAASP